MTQLVKTSRAYAKWIEAISRRYRSSQIKAATHVNSEMLKFYWMLGRDIVVLHAESRWGDKFFHNLSVDLKNALPGVKGLSETNIGYAKRFYLLYNQYFIIHPQLGGELGNEPTSQIAPQVGGELGNSISEIVPQVMDGLEDSPIWLIPWGHHRYIIDRLSKEPEKAMFFVQKMN